MLRGKRFARKTRRGHVVTVQREHYLRDDIACGCAGCTVCMSGAAGQVEGVKFCLDRSHTILVPDTNVALHQVGDVCMIVQFEN